MKKELIKGQLKDTPGKSNNQIAKMLGVSPHTVIKYRKELEERLQIANADKLEDTQGRKQPAEKKTKTVTTRTERDQEKAQEIVEKARGGDEKAKELIDYNEFGTKFIITRKDGDKFDIKNISTVGAPTPKCSDTEHLKCENVNNTDFSKINTLPNRG